METLLYILIGVGTYTAMVYMAVKEPKAIFIALVELAALAAILLILKVSAGVVNKSPEVNSTVGVVGLISAVIIKQWISPVYRLKDGFVLKDRAYRKSVFPAIDFDGYDLLLYTKMHKSKNSLARRIPLKGPRKDHNKRKIQQIYHG